jgi:hypothetical protein
LPNTPRSSFGEITPIHWCGYHGAYGRASLNIADFRRSTGRGQSSTLKAKTSTIGGRQIG